MCYSLWCNAPTMLPADGRQHRGCIIPQVVCVCVYIYKFNGKSVPLQAWSGPEGSRKLRFPDFMTTAQEGGKVGSLTHRPHLLPRKFSWYSSLLEAESTPGT